MVPFFILYRKQAIPYFAALLSHILIGDFFNGGIELLWPLSEGWFGVLYFDVISMPNVITELVLFLLTLPLMYKWGDLKSLLKPYNRNWSLIVPLGAVVGPLVSVGRGQESSLPTLLVVPSLFFVFLFVYSLIVYFRRRHGRRRDKCILTISEVGRFLLNVG
jgi:hypothetical protein